MKINQTGTNPAQSGEIANSKKTDRAAQAKGAKKTDVAVSSGSADAPANISTRGREMAKAKAVAAAAPDVREEKIAELKKRIAAGKYNIDENAIADRLVKEHSETSGLG